MATTTIQVLPKTTVGTQIVYAGEGPVLITNTDLNNIIYLGDDDGIRSTDSVGIVPLNPNGSIVVDGNSDLYAVNPNSTTVVVATLTGGLANFLGLTQGGGNLAIPSIQSPNFNLANPSASPSPSWAILKTGIAYFFGLFLTGGTFEGPDYIINPNGMFFYTGTPAVDALALSIVPGPNATDPFGNITFSGVSTYAPNIGGGYFQYNTEQGETEVFFGLHMNNWTSSVAISTYVPTVVGGAIQSINTVLGGSLTRDAPHVITLDANWSTLGGQPVPSYLFTVDKSVQLTGALQFNVNIANNNINGGSPLPTAYRPQSEIFIAGAPGAAGVTIQTNGVLVAAQSPGQTTVFCNFNGVYPLNILWRRNEQETTTHNMARHIPEPNTLCDSHSHIGHVASCFPDRSRTNYGDQGIRHETYHAGNVKDDVPWNAVTNRSE